MKKITKIFLSATAVIPSIYLGMIKPGKRKTRLMKRLKHFDYAHRGLHDNKESYPENSMAAFKRAVERGYGIELDVHLTKDKQLIVFHDDTLTRMCGIDKEVCDCTANELTSLHLLETNETIPYFKDVLQLVNGQVPLIVEVKVEHDNFNELCAAVDDMLESYTGDYCIESFHPLAVLWYKKNNSEVIRGQLSCSYKKPDKKRSPLYTFLAYLGMNFLTKPDFIAYSQKDLNNLSFILNHKYFKAMTFIWTVRELDDLKKLKEQGHTIIFENFEP